MVMTVSTAPTTGVPYSAMEETLLPFYSLLVAIFTVTIVSISILLRRLLLKPKSSSARLPPSPTSLPIIGHLHLLSLPLHHALIRLSRRYGPVFLLRFGRRSVLVVSSPAAVEDCLVKNDVVFANRPRLPSLKDLTYNFTSFGTAPYGPGWRNHRRIAQALFFSPNRLHALFTTVIQEEVELWIRGLLFRHNNSNNKEVSILSKTDELTTNIIVKALAGKRCVDKHGEATKEGRKCRRILDEYFSVFSSASVDDFLPLLKWLRCFKGTRDVVERRLRVLEREMEELLCEMLEERKRERLTAIEAAATKTSSLIDSLLSLQETEGPEPYSDLLIKGIVQSLLLAGGSSPAGTVEWAMALLLNHPEVQEKAQLEILVNVGENRLLNDSDLPDLPYLKNIIKETLRLFPIGPILLPRESTEECTVGGFHIPSGTILFVNIYAIHRDPEVWADPTLFKPERFEHVTTEKEKVFLPFGLGRRSCPGDNMAIRMASLALGALIQCFEWERIGEEEVDMTEGSRINMGMVNPLVAKYKPRKSMLHVISGL